MQREPFIWSKLPEDVVFTICREVYEFDMYIYTRESYPYGHIEGILLNIHIYESKIRTIGATMRKI